MNCIPVDSSSISEICYDEPTQTLQIQFRHGGSYQYFDVPVTIYQELMAAPSKGAYLVEQIKGRHRYARV
jgi:hypothetical protein